MPSSRMIVLSKIAYTSRLNSISAPAMPSRQAHAFGVLGELLGVFESDGVPEVVLADESCPRGA